MLKIFPRFPYLLESITPALSDRDLAITNAMSFSFSPSSPSVHTLSLTHQACLREEAAGGPLTASGAVRLHRLEILHTRQTTALVALERELSKSRLKLHGMSRDMHPALRQVPSNLTDRERDGVSFLMRKLHLHQRSGCRDNNQEVRQKEKGVPDLKVSFAYKDA